MAAQRRSRGSPTLVGRDSLMRRRRRPTDGGQEKFVASSASADGSTSAAGVSARASRTAGPADTAAWSSPGERCPDGPVALPSHAMLRLDRSPAQLARLGDRLRALAADDAARFATLFDPLAPRGPVSLDEAIARELLGAGLVARLDDGRWRGLHRIRRRGERLYVLELGIVEYRQDVWPETDALLDVLDGARAGRLLDVGTGCGIVAIEGAARGHRVVATDLYPSALWLARWNAALNRVEGIDFRVGHLLEPVRGERFDLVLTAPHYGRVFDQLRLEVLVDGPAHLADGGLLALATQLEWEGEDGPLAAVEALLAPLFRDGAAVTVRPIEAAEKRDWFTAVRVDEPIAGLVSHARFLVTVAPSGRSLTVERPADPPRRRCAPLARFSPGATAVISTDDDVSRLRALLASLDAGEDPGALPAALLDGCRFGERSCVADGADGAAGAILDAAGGVRPCAHGGVVASARDSLATLRAALRARAEEAFARRGCERCAARAWCSRCLFPAPLDEAAYCELMRASGTALPRLHRLLEP